MTEDILTVLWKEWKSMFRTKGGRSRFVMILLSPVIMAVVFPLMLDTSQEWTDGFFSIIVSVIVPMLLVAVTIPDSFAG